MCYDDGTRVYEKAEKIKNLFRPFPLIFIMLFLVVLIHFLPEIKSGLAEYMQDVENPGAYKTLYYATIPLFIATIPVGILQWKTHQAYFWGILFFSLTLPWAIGFSIWLWEWIGIIWMGFFLLCMLAMYMEEKEDEDDKEAHMDGLYLGLYVTGGLAYLVFRLFGSHTAQLDLSLIGMLFLFTLAKSITVACQKFSFSTPFFLSLTFGIILCYLLF
ncbi:MAG: hypothetical protein LIP08_10825 [Bacteroides sp.]|nr:hypothetical protein [Bacteroides sp.]